MPIEGLLPDLSHDLAVATRRHVTIRDRKGVICGTYFDRPAWKLVIRVDESPFLLAPDAGLTPLGSWLVDVWRRMVHKKARHLSGAGS